MSSLVPIYIITAVISMCVALLLVHLAKLSGQSKVRLDRGGKSSGSQDGLDDDLRQAIFDQVNGLEGAAKHSQEITERVSGILSNELKKEVTRTTQELSQKYETIIGQKAKSEDIAWNKYKKALSGKKETDAVIRSIASGLVVVGKNGQIQMMNPAAEKLFGASKKDKIGKNILEDLKQEQLVSLSKDMKGGEGKEIEIMSRESETKKILRSSSAVIEDENGQTVGMVCVLSDITKQKELDQLKSDFVSKVSHELRTPLITVRNSLDLILGKSTGPLSEKQEKFLNIAQRNLERLALLVDDILDLSKLEATKMELHIEPRSIEKTIEEVCETLATWAGTKEISIKRKVQQNMHELNFDGNRIIQVLTNIMGNAVKFTPKGGTITVQADVNEQDKNVAVSVIDTGPGIAKENLGKVFDKFRQVGGQAAANMSGTGLGLAIAKEIVELHAGKIWVECEEGQGARFSFTLPMPS